MSVECCVKEEENSLGFYVANSEENLITRVAAAETINTEDSVMTGEFKKQKAKELKQNWREKKMHVKCQIKLIRMTLGSGYPKVICRSEQKPCYVLHRNRPSGQSI